MGKQVLLNRDLSLFSPQAISERHHRGLLIQFILFELLESYKAYRGQENWNAILSFHPRHFPYDWSAVTGYLNKAQEHSLLLKKSFPDHAKLVKAFERELFKIVALLAKRKKVSKEQLSQALRKIYLAFEPLTETCRENENLVFFLLKNREAIDALIHEGYLKGFLLRIHPCDLETLGEKMCDQYHQRGFFSQISEFKILLAELVHA
jgi:hypothetical protein